jgi:hypothetical protein
MIHSLDSSVIPLARVATSIALAKVVRIAGFLGVSYELRNGLWSAEIFCKVNSVKASIILLSADVKNGRPKGRPFSLFSSLYPQPPPNHVHHITPIAQRYR